MTDLVSVRDLSKTFGGRGGKEVNAVVDVSLSLRAGETLGIVGESGSGKTTIGRIICGLERPTSGHVTVAGFDMTQFRHGPDRRFYDSVQMMFQDPYQSLNPRMSVGEALAYPLKIRGIRRGERDQRVLSMLARVGLPSAAALQLPHQMSTGQRQRDSIARALMPNPALIVADEPVSSLDVSLQAQILNLIVDLQQETGVAILFISHDLAVVAYICPAVIVMRQGEVVEAGESRSVLDAPQNAYTRALVSAARIGV
jgi:peptide/nickel transport system ATP-binding protein